MLTNKNETRFASVSRKLYQLRMNEPEAETYLTRRQNSNQPPPALRPPRCLVYWLLKSAFATEVTVALSHRVETVGRAWPRSSA